MIKQMIRRWWFWAWMVGNGLIIRYQLWQIDRIREKLFGGN